MYVCQLPRSNKTRLFRVHNTASIKDMSNDNNVDCKPTKRHPETFKTLHDHQQTRSGSQMHKATMYQCITTLEIQCSINNKLDLIMIYQKALYVPHTDVIQPCPVSVLGYLTSQFTTVVLILKSHSSIHDYRDYTTSVTKLQDSPYFIALKKKKKKQALEILIFIEYRKLVS